MSGRGCHCCSKSGFDKNESAVLYYIKFETENKTLYKIGITNKTTKIRLRGMGIPKNIKTTILQELFFKSGSDAMNMETKILKEFKEFKYKDAPIMNNGNSELFIVDVLKLDDGNMQH